MQKQNGVAKIRMYQRYTTPPPFVRHWLLAIPAKNLQNAAHFFELYRFLERSTIRSVSKGFHLKFLGNDNAIY